MYIYKFSTKLENIKKALFKVTETKSKIKYYVTNLL